MTSETRVVNCDECGRDLTEEVKIDPECVCPDCGSKMKYPHLIVRTSIKLSPDSYSKVRDPSGFLRQEERSKTEIYEKTGEPVNNSYSVDRTGSDMTTNHHKIVSKGIIPKIIHEHVDESPAKHRPKNTE